MLKGLGRLEEAEARYSEGLALIPKYAEAVYNLGLPLTALGRLDEAKASYRKAIALISRYVGACPNLCDLHKMNRTDSVL